MIVPVYRTLVICLRAALNVLLFSLSSYCFLYIAWGFSKCGREGAKWILKSWRCLLKGSVWNHLTPRWRKRWCWFMGVLGFIKKPSCFLPMGFLLLYRILFLIFISELLKRKKDKVVIGGYEDYVCWNYWHEPVSLLFKSCLRGWKGGKYTDQSELQMPYVLSVRTGFFSDFGRKLHVLRSFHLMGNKGTSDSSTILCTLEYA